MNRTTAIRTFFVLLLMVFWGPSIAHASTGPDTSLCVQCHSSWKTNPSHATVPEAPGVCLTCHAPHSALGAPALQRPQMDRCTECHSQFSSTTLSKEQKAGSKVHDPVLKQNCGMCHLPHTTFDSPGFVGDDKNASCVNCHTNTMKAAQLSNQHPPFANGDCISCHDPHVSKEHAMLIGPVAGICAACHNGTTGQAGLPTQHKPFSQGRCLDCHAAHASSNPNILIQPTTQLCVSCHLPKDANKKYPHAPYESGDCTVCHASHATTAASLVKTDSPRDLCISCHGDIGQPNGAPSRHPAGKQLQCTGCHAPHSSDNAKLIGGEGGTGCAACHPDQGAQFSKSLHGSCTVCHQAHGFEGSPPAASNAYAQCQTCHTPKPHGQHPVGGSTVDPTTGKPLTCSSCHSLHGSSNPHSLLRSGDGLCLTCHDM